MSVEAIFKRYPTLTAIADHPKLRADLEAATVAAANSADHKGLWEAYWAGRFTANELTFWLCIDQLGGVGDGTADEIEANLRTIVATVGEPKVRSAYRDKLLVNGKKPFTDARYEIGAAAGASAWLAPGSMELEAGIAGGKKN